MTQSSRKTDQVKIENCSPGMCPGCSHGPQVGMINQPCASGVKIEGLKAARITDMGQVQCPHGGQFKIIKTASKTFIDGKLAARVGDKVQCMTCGSPGTIVKGASKTITHN